MNETKKWRWNLLDVMLLLLLVAAVVAFALRGWIWGLFDSGSSRVVTYTIAIEGVEEQTAASLKLGEPICDEHGHAAGKLLNCDSTEATDAVRLADGSTVQVYNELRDLTCTVVASGYEADGFVYLDSGILLVPGETLSISTGDAFFVVRITSVSLSDVAHAA